MNNKNLKTPTSEQAREYGRKGGLASAKKRKEKKELQAIVNAIFETNIPNKKTGEMMSGAEAIAWKQFEKAMKGDTRAFEVLRDTAGQKPTEHVDTTINTISEEDRKELSDFLNEK